MQDNLNNLDSYALFNLAKNYFHGKNIERDHKKSFEYIQASADKGNPDALNELGDYYYCGIGVDQDYKKAINCYQLSAEKNNVSAIGLANLVFCYYYGCGVDRNYKKAFEYFQASADRGNVDVLNVLGHCYYYGKGVEKDYKKALESYKSPSLIRCCEHKLLELYQTSLVRDNYVYAYPLYVKHNYNGLVQLKRLLHSEYVINIMFIPKVLQSIVISYLI